MPFRATVWFVPGDNLRLYREQIEIEKCNLARGASPSEYQMPNKLTI
jgi:hypothetical protein